MRADFRWVRRLLRARNYSTGIPRGGRQKAAWSPMDLALASLPPKNGLIYRVLAFFEWMKYWFWVISHKN